jgi:hypothetical protein
VIQRLTAQEFASQAHSKGVKKLSLALRMLRHNQFRLEMRGGFKVWDWSQFKTWLSEAIHETELLELQERMPSVHDERTPARAIANCDEAGSRSLTAESGESGRQVPPHPDPSISEGGAVRADEVEGADCAEGKGGKG